MIGDVHWNRELTVSSSTPGVMRCVQFLQALLCHVGIDLRRGQVTVSQQHLHHAKISTMIHQMRCKGMA